MEHMEHVVYDEKPISCPNCREITLITGKVHGVELVDWKGLKIYVTLYYRLCSKCQYYRIL